MSSSPTLKEKVIKRSIVVLFLAFLGSIFAYLIRVLYPHMSTQVIKKICAAIENIYSYRAEIKKRKSPRLL